MEISDPKNTSDNNVCPECGGQGFFDTDHPVNVIDCEYCDGLGFI